MCNTDTANLIDDVVNEKVNGDEMFTAFDISLAVKERAKASGLPVERHRHMKRQIHTTVAPFVSNGLYESTTKDVGAGTPAILYYPTNADPDQYVPLPRNDSPKGQKTKQAPQVGLFDSSDDDSSDDDGFSLTVSIGVDSNGKSVDARGTLGVPNSYIRDAGFKQGDRVYVSPGNHNGEQALVLSDDDTASLTSYTVDNCDRVRITDRTLRKGGIACPDGYKFNLDNNTVFVTPSH